MFKEKVKDLNGKFTYFTPMDFSIKKKLIFRCKFPLYWMSEIISENDFSDKRKKIEKNEIKKMKKSFFDQACLQYNFPGAGNISFLFNKFDEVKNHLETREKSKFSFFENRRNCWQSSFRSLYYSLRRKKISYFYVLVEDRTSFTVLFFLKEKKLTAFISNVTKKLRLKLRKSGLKFTNSLTLDHVKKIASLKRNVKKKKEIKDKKNCKETYVHNIF